MMSLSKSSRITAINGVLEECDIAAREVMFYLYKRPIDNVVSGHAELHHWALVAVFKDELVRTMEGIISEGILKANYFKESPSDSECGGYWPLIAMISSPYKLSQVTIRNRLNDTTYNATNNNCQDWVKTAANTISSNLATALRNYKKNGVVCIKPCCRVLSRYPTKGVASTLKEFAIFYWSHSTNLEVHNL